MSEEIAAPNTREAMVRRFIAKPPRKAATLRLDAVAEGGPVRLSTHEAAEVTPELAREILHALDEHAREVGGRVQALLQWCDRDGQVLASSKLSRQAAHVVMPSADAQVEALQTDRDGVTALAMAHASQSMQLMVRSQAAITQQLLTANQALLSMCESLAQRVVETDDRERESRRELQMAQEELAAAAAKGQEPSPDVVTRLLPLLQPVLVRMLSAPASPPVVAPPVVPTQG
jgi:hypothetical protein